MAKQTKGGQGGPGKKRPGVWLCGPDEYKHSMYQPWLLSRAHANFRGETFLLSFEEYYSMWHDHWPQRGRGADDLCMTREDPEGPWSVTNTIICARKDHLRRQGHRRWLQGLK